MPTAAKPATEALPSATARDTRLSVSPFANWRGQEFPCRGPCHLPGPQQHEGSDARSTGAPGKGAGRGLVRHYSYETPRPE